MCRLISFGENNKFYKYIYIYLIISLILLAFFNPSIDEIKIRDFPEDIIIQQMFDYLGIFILSLLFYLYFYRKKNEHDNQRTSSIYEINNSSRTQSFTSSHINLIYNQNDENRSISVKQFLILVILLVFTIQLENNYYNVGLDGLDFWMFEIIFISIIYTKIFKAKIYLHHKMAMGFIVIFYIPIMIVYYCLLIKKKDKTIIYIKYIWIIPIGIIIYLIILFFQSYILCKLKWFLDFKYISPLKFLIWYGFIGSLICLIFGIISTEIKCIDESTFSDIKQICCINKTIDDTSVNLYYDNFSVYFINLWKIDKSNWYNIASIFLLLLRIILCFSQKYFSILIIQKLNPVYFICAHTISYCFDDTFNDILDLYK